MKNEITGNAFFLGIGGQAIGPRQIDNAQVRVIMRECALLALDSLARPVAHVLTEACQKVKDG